MVFAVIKTRRVVMKKLDKKPVLYFATLVVIIIWSITFISTKSLLKYLSPFEIIFFRYVIAYAIFWVIDPHPIIPKNMNDEIRFAACGIFGVSLNFMFENTALLYSTAANVSLLVSSAPMLTGVVAHFMIKEKITKRFLWGCLFGTGGVFLIVFNGRFILNLNPLGDLLAVCAALSFSVFSVIMKGVDQSYKPTDITRKSFFYALLSLIPLLFTPLFKWNPTVLLMPEVWGHLLFLGLLASALCFILWNKVIWELGPVKANNLIYLSPPLTMIFAAMLLDERITIFAITGGILILIGVYIAQRGKSFNKTT